MGFPTLTQFICDVYNKIATRNHVVEDGFSELILQGGSRRLEGVLYEYVLEVCIVTAEHPGQGTWTRFVAKLPQDVVLFVESVQNHRFARKLLQDGFTKVKVEAKSDGFSDLPPNPSFYLVGSQAKGI